LSGQRAGVAIDRHRQTHQPRCRTFNRHLNPLTAPRSTRGTTS
jgi:hypothetical protein